MVAALIFLTFLMIEVRTEHFINSRISNGEVSVRGQFPFMASIQLIVPPSTTYVHMCGGTILDKYWILTSAICVIKTLEIERASVKIHMYYTEKNDSKVQIIKIKTRIIHQSFNRSSKVKPNDIGLIKLEAAISYHVAAKLPDSRIPLIGDAWMMGWGRISVAAAGAIPEVLHYAEVRILENEICEQLMGNSRQLGYSHICTHSPRKSITACRGDGGGPLIRYVNGEPEVIGIVSWIVQPCAQIGAPTVNTRVSHFNTWIIERIGKTENKMSDSDSLLTPLLAPQ